MHPDYLVHFNKNHSKKNGQFISGDGDSDGVADEHHRYSKNGIRKKKTIDYDKKVHNPIDMSKRETSEYQNKLQKVHGVIMKHDAAFNNSEEGKRLKRELESARKEFYKQYSKYDKYFKGYDDNGNVVFSNKDFVEKYMTSLKKFENIYYDYYQKKGEEVCKNMLKELSEYDVASYSLGWDRPIAAKNTADLIKQFGEEYRTTYPDKEDSPW